MLKLIALSNNYDIIDLHFFPVTYRLNLGGPIPSLVHLLSGLGFVLGEGLSGYVAVAVLVVFGNI